MQQSNITAQAIQQNLEKHTTKKKFVVGYSGGLDSHVLLHLMVQLQSSGYQIRALYVDHGLQSESSDWAAHCINICRKLEISFATLGINLGQVKGQSIEALAREKRYQALHQNMHDDEALLTAHHQSDQAETLFLQLLRGSGVHGLASMPIAKEFGVPNRLHLRPLLEYSRQQLADYATAHQLDYINDPSNTNVDFDRNFLRKKIIPLLKQRWPGLERTLARVAAIQSESLGILTEVADDELSAIASEQHQLLPVSGLFSLPLAKQKLVLRQWILVNGFPLSSESKLNHLISDVVHASEGSQPLITWQGTEIRRFRDHLYILAPMAEHDATEVLEWQNPQEAIDLPWLGTTIRPLEQDLLDKVTKKITVRFRQGGEKIYIAKRGCTISLKNLFQEKDVPPWLRDRTPLIFSGNKLIKVIGIT